MVDVSFNLSSREYNGKYYHNIDAWRINKTASSMSNESENTSPFPSEEDSEEDDLPF